MNKNKIIATMAAIAVMLGGGLYWAVGELTGNQVEIESVIKQTPAELNGAGAELLGTEGAEEMAEPDRVWNIQPESKVYFSVTTSRETVNYQMDQVTGFWSINTRDPSQTKAEGTVDLLSMDSGNAQRDKHISEAQYMDIEQYPTANFKASSFEGLPGDWISGDVYDVKITGDLTVKGITRKVDFNGQTTYDQGALKLEANTVVTFADFGMNNPHTIVMDMENNLTIELRLILDK
ncbi:YceI family protein [Paenibacillus alkaliterrae]|uniref:YceI family protein n=1 Tax=Paenibacillus alkaliterrae TaxID=320909 RepID=UPI001F28A7EA|nr:YceI family protein [Paenibacillus alkaliterrae]MCF2941199.1 YceI family protein [Paenibacillus alkaliterrae]